MRSHFQFVLNWFTVAALCIALVVSAVQVTPAYAASIVVNSNEDTDTVNVNDGKCTLREAITAANTDLPRGGCTAGSAGVDTISFAANYIITVGSQLPFVTTAMTITGNGAANTIIQAAATPNTATWRVFQVSPAGTLTLDGVTVRHGQCDGLCTVVGNVEPDAGGGIYNSGTLTVMNSVISGNRGSLGGGIYNNGGTVTVTNSTISDNNALIVTTEQDGGGGIRNTGTLTITDSTISDNEALSGGGIFSSSGTLTVINTTITGNIVTSNEITGIGGAAGGGIFQDGGTSTVMNSTVTANSADYGGGIHNSGIHISSEMTITDSTISGNTVNSGGGGINNGDIMTITNSTISGNSSKWTGGITNSGTLTMTNSTISGNSAVGTDGFPSHGGISNFGSLTVTSSTISGNTANNLGSGILISGGTVSLRNTIVSGNSPANCIVTNTTITDDGNNLEDNTTCGWGTSNGSLSNTDPLLGALVNNGGHTKTMALLSGSPAIDAGNDANCPATDQRGGARPQGSHCDIGAYESGAPVTYISTFLDVPDNYWALTFIDRLYEAGITGGCSTTPLNYCPDTIITRDQMAVFLLRGIHNSSYSPPAVGGSTGFGDVPTTYWAAAWIKQLAVEGITGGCGGSNYCPTGAVTRDQIAVFLLKAKHGSSYVPPPVGGDTGFGDVPTTHWAGAWIKQLAAEGITGGCSAGVYCPGAPVTRAQMAVFLVRTFNLP
jgi:CSLREA domain-containing protein